MAGMDAVTIPQDLQRALVQYLLKVGPPAHPALSPAPALTSTPRSRGLTSAVLQTQEYREKGGQVTVPPNVVITGREPVDLRKLLTILQAGARQSSNFYTARLSVPAISM